MLGAVGWYLMIAPLWTSTSDPAASVSQWQIMRSYDSARDCEQVRKQPGKGDAQIFVKMSGEKTADGFFYRTNCLATDDPRLAQ